MSIPTIFLLRKHNHSGQGYIEDLPFVSSKLWLLLKASATHICHDDQCIIDAEPLLNVPRIQPTSDRDRCEALEYHVDNK